MTALMDRPTSTNAPSPRRPNRRRRIAVLRTASLLAAAVLAIVVYALTRPGPVQVQPAPLPPLQAAQAQCQAGIFSGDGSLVLDVAADANEASVACVVQHLGIPADRYAMIKTALHDAVPDFGNATNTISWGRFYAVVTPNAGRARVQIVLL